MVLKRSPDKDQTAEIEDVLFETMAVSISVDCVVIEEACRIGDSVAWDTKVLTAKLVLLKEQFPCLRLFSEDIFNQIEGRKHVKETFVPIY